MKHAKTYTAPENIGRYLKTFIKAGILYISIGASLYGQVSAEVDPDVLMNILSAIAGTGATSSGITTTDTPPASADIDNLSLSIQPNAKVNEMIDLIVQAKTKDGNIFTDYKGTVFISIENDNKAIIPYPDGYSFTADDNGIKIFSKGLSFSKAGNFKISVSDFSRTDIGGATYIKIEAPDTSTETTQAGDTSTETTQDINDTSTLSSSSNTNNTSTAPLLGTQTMNQASNIGLPTFKIEKVEIGDKRATITFKVLNDTKDIQRFKFLYADSQGISKSVVTSPKEKIQTKNGDYTWYIPNLELTKYVISIAGVGKDGESIDGITSQPFEANLSLSAAGKCIIPNVSGLRVLKKKDSSVLYWDNLPEAIMYKIYKKDASGEYVFLSETKKDSYTIHVADGSVKYEEFSIKAVCADGTESLKFSPSTSVQTGPREIGILIILSTIIGWFIIRKKKKGLG